MLKPLHYKSQNNMSIACSEKYNMTKAMKYNVKSEKYNAKSEKPRSQISKVKDSPRCRFVTLTITIFIPIPLE